MPRWTEADYEQWKQKRSAVAGLQDPKREPDQRSKIQDRQLEKGPKRMAIRVSIISVRKRFVDEHDNLRTGAKPLVDAITTSLGFTSDNDPRLHWEYGQVLGTKAGTIVKIEAISD